ncbi:MAG: hypothetical protein AAFS10_26915, partial [Myxococcota bacterium]
LAEEADADAEALSPWVNFRTPVDLIMAHLTQAARVDQPLEAQEPWLADMERLAHIAALIARHSGPDTLRTLPWTLSYQGHLIRGRCLDTDADTRLLMDGLPLGKRLADTRWIATLKPLAPELVEHLPLRRVLEALLDASRTSTPVADHPLWHDPNRRQALYRWIDAHRATIADDPNLAAPPGGASNTPPRAGVLPAPRHLLMEGSPLEELASSQPADEVPTTLRQTLGQLYALDGDQTRRLVELLADAHRAAQSQEDGSRSAAILEAMAQALDPKRVEADLRQDLLQRHKVARLRIELHGGAFEQIRRVMAPGAEHQQLLSSFLTQRPPTAHPRYGAPAIRALLVAVGASPALSEEHLRQLLAAPDTHLHPSTSAAVALAHYIARLLEEEPGLLSALSLDQTAWIPNGDGHLCRPSDLYWPTPDLESILGQPTARLPHPAWVDLVSSDVRRRLPLLTLERAALADVIAHIGAQGQPFTMTPAVLEWFEASLRGGHLDPKAVQDALSDLLLFDDYGTLRHSSQLLCTPAEHLFGHRRGT